MAEKLSVQIRVRDIQVQAQYPTRVSLRSPIRLLRSHCTVENRSVRNELARLFDTQGLDLSSPVKAEVLWSDGVNRTIIKPPGVRIHGAVAVVDGAYLLHVATGKYTTLREWRKAAP